MNPEKINMMSYHEIINTFNLNFKKKHIEEKYQSSIDYPKTLAIIMSLVLIVIGITSMSLMYLQYYEWDIKHEAEINSELIERIVILTLDCFGFVILFLCKKTQLYLINFYLFYLISPNFQGIDIFFNNDTSSLFKQEFKTIMFIISNSIEFYIKLSFVYMFGLHHFSVILVLIINSLYGVLFYYIHLGSTKLLLYFFSRIFYDIGFIFLSYKKNLDFKISFYTQHQIIKQSRNIDLLDSINCGILTIKGHNRIKKINKYLQNLLNIQSQIDSKTYKNVDTKTISTEKIMKEDFDMEALNSRRRISKHNSSQIKNVKGLTKNSEINFTNYYDEDEIFIQYLLGNLTEINEDLNKEFYEFLKDNKPLEYLKNIYLSRDFDNFTYIGVKFLEFEEKEKFYLEVNLRRINNRIEVILNDISKRKIIEETQNELTNRTLYLSKLAHEFKNPLLSLSEVSHDIDEKLKSIMDPNLLSNITSIYSDLALIRNLSEYLMILVKDTELISLADFKKDIIFIIKKCELLSILEFCKNIMNMRINSLSKNVKFNYKISSNVPESIYIDETRLKQIIINILSNSLKFTENGEISLIIEREEEGHIKEDDNEFILILTITDTGKGISKNNLDKIFKPFNKSCCPDNQIGSGLGICIVKDMIEKLGGSISITSDIGTKVVIRLPIENSKSDDNRYCNFVRKNRGQIFKSVIIKNINALNSNEIKIKGEVDHCLEEKGDRIISISSKNVRGSINNNVNINININMNEEKKVQNKTQRFISTKNINNLDLNNFDNCQKSSEKKLIVTDKKIDKFDYENIIFKFPQSNLKESEIDSSEEDTIITILLVDDEKFSRNATRRMIKNFLDKREIKYEIIEACDGIEALYHLIKTIKIENNRIDLVISDLNMNPLGGLGLAKVISEVEYFKSQEIKFYLLSAGAITFTAPYIDCYLEKPLNEYSLHSIFSKFLFLG